MRDQSDYLLPKGNATSRSGGHKMQLSPRLELIIASTLVLDKPDVQGSCGAMYAVCTPYAELQLCAGFNGYCWAGGKGAKEAIHCETYWLITTYIAGSHLQVSPRDSLSIHHHMQGERLSVLPRPLSVSLHHIEAPTLHQSIPTTTLARLMSTPAGSLSGFSGHGQYR
ncbi:hypothetical protein GE21DRAFT_7001 [Neurospora crassa]|uniref:Uncharacterized protein n=2 Tax=Neurospora crassa TaxID=5141 RepID=Q1K6J4_NEUCR|nr:hypothetical protein NCU09687 [Neurospora crassa OR74A]EAA31383.3 hypothetical protein NCU09687 [Neurospora crassa OR74A]KHE79269.1 hypothetical protein GE21DRAFT_7001 [Neurospora crassa]CAD70727.1 hypothetical protein [Neurospora crassa]|eukprot:XP_960619.3 hypothetical protein NCU09687 [Neurospora crassa OR74A]